MQVCPAISILNMTNCGLTYDAGAKSVFSSLARNPKAANINLILKDNPELKVAVLFSLSLIH